MAKGKPVISYDAGGIPLQIKNNLSGYVLDTIGDTSGVAEKMYGLFTNKKLYRQMSADAKKHKRDDVWTIPNAINWLYLGTELLNNRAIVGNHQYVRALAKNKYWPTKEDLLKKKIEPAIENINRQSLNLLNGSKNYLNKTSLNDEITANQAPVNFTIDLSLFASDKADLQNNITNLAYLIALYKNAGNINYIFEKGFGNLQRKDLPYNLISDINNSPEIEDFLVQLRNKIKKISTSIDDKFLDTHIKNREDEIPTSETQTRPIEIPIISKELAVWMRNNNIELADNQYPIAMGGLTGTDSKSLPLRNFEAAFAIGLAKAALALATNKAKKDTTDSNAAKELSDLKIDLLKKLNNLYDQIRPGVKLDNEALDYLVHENSTQRLNRSIETYLPPIERIAIDQLQYLHKTIQLFLQAA